MYGFFGNIEEQTRQNSYFRKVIFTAPKSQLVLMSLKPGEDIGLESHPVDQFFRIESGQAKILIDREEFDAHEDYAAVVPAGATHNVLNTGRVDLKLYTIYSPHQHPDGTIHKTKAEAEEYEKKEHLK